MKNSIYITLALAGLLSMGSCNDDDFLPGNPSMEIQAENADALFGDSLPFTIKASDVDVPLSTLKARLFYGEEMVSETVIRTKMSGSDYTGKIFIPFYPNISNGKATLKYVLQNINFTTTEVEKELTVARPDFPYLTLVDSEGNEHRMDKQSLYNYSATGDFSQQMKAYIKTPKVGAHGNELTFGWESNAITIGSTTSIPFSSTEPGSYSITFNTFTYEASPFAKLLLNGKEMELVENDIYTLKLALKQNDILTFEGVSGYDEWWIDPDFFAKQEDGTLKFLPIDGNYQITANGKLQYFSAITLKDGNPAKLQDDGSGAIWAIGEGIGKPSTAQREVGWTPENGLCMPQLTAKKYQLTFTAGVSMKTNAINFKFFHINKWDNGEFKGDAISTTSELVKISESGNIELQTGQKFERGGVYKFVVDVTKGNTKAVLTVEKVGQVELPMPDITVNGVKLEDGGSDLYQAQFALTQNQELGVVGIEDWAAWKVDPDYLTKTASNTLKFLPLAGSYRIIADAAHKYFSAVRMNGSATASLGADGHGAIWLMGWGVGSPSLDFQFGWNSGRNYGLAEVASKVYQFTAIAGPEQGSTIGQRIRADYVSCKFFFQDGWGEEFSGTNALTLTTGAKLYLADKGNIELADGVQLTVGATYVITVDLTAGNDKGVLSVVKK